MLSAEEKMVYRLHYRTMQFKIKNSLQIISSFLEKFPNSHISVSWGKDSIVVLDLCYRIKKLPVLWVDRGRGGDTSDVYELADYYREKGYDIHQVKTPFSIMELHEKYSMTELEKGKIITKMLKNTCNDFNRNYDGFFWGVRAEESAGRKMFAKTYKEIFQRKAGFGNCSPVLNWTAKDIWAYISENDIKYNAFYDKMSRKPFDREQIRYSNLAGLVGIQNGRIAEMKKADPELYRELIEIRPEYRNFT